MFSGNKGSVVKKETGAQDGESQRQQIPAEVLDDGVGTCGIVERKRLYLINANEKLRRGIKDFRERQETLLEFIDVEYGSDKLELFEENKKRVMYVLGMTDSDIEEGRQNEKYIKMIRILRLAAAYWRLKRSQINRPSNTEARLRYEQGVPHELAELRLHVNWDNGLIGRKPVKRCHKCYDESHEMKYCPFKHPNSRTPEVNAMIAARFKKLKKEEGSDPTLSQAYKKKHFKIETQKDIKRKHMREMRRQAKQEKRKSRVSF